jgi:hypothetical protein
MCSCHGSKLFRISYHHNIHLNLCEFGAQDRVHVLNALQLNGRAIFRGYNCVHETSICLHEQTKLSQARASLQLILASFPAVLCESMFSRQFWPT